eukprot:Hpha_TRINITY_DN32177_c0_g1::TRINITY_DN32177_c0_g1_i1::g.18486::m.18486
MVGREVLDRVQCTSSVYQAGSTYPEQAAARCAQSDTVTRVVRERLAEAIEPGIAPKRIDLETVVRKVDTDQRTHQPEHIVLFASRGPADPEDKGEGEAPMFMSVTHACLHSITITIDGVAVYNFAWLFNSPFKTAKDV